jgi:hypothetical protein
MNLSLILNLVRDRTTMSETKKVIQSSFQAKKIQEPLQVFSGGKPVRKQSQVNTHHGGSAYHKEYSKLTGKDEMFTYTGNAADGVAGARRLTKDFVITGKGGDLHPGVPSAVNGYVFYGKHNIDGKGAGLYAYVVDKAEMGADGKMKPAKDAKVIFRALHLKNSSLPQGHEIKIGDIVGTQGDSGTNHSSLHSHVELPENLWPGYFEMLQTGKIPQMNKDNKAGTKNVTSSNSLSTTISESSQQIDLNSLFTQLYKNAELAAQNQKGDSQISGIEVARQLISYGENGEKAFSLNNLEAQRLIGDSQENYVRKTFDSATDAEKNSVNLDPKQVVQAQI